MGLEIKVVRAGGSLGGRSRRSGEGPKLCGVNDMRSGEDRRGGRDRSRIDRSRGIDMDILGMGTDIL